MRLIIAANRAPYHIRKRDGQAKVERSPGGLVTALDPVMKKTKGIWVCSGTLQFEKHGLETPYDIEQIKLTPKENTHYYEGFCNRQIWPLFHYFLAKYKLEERDWEFYKQVNQKFANQIAEIVKKDDKIWIQDYHLMLVPQMLRELGVKNKIGFFLHIPFPNIENFRVIPRRKEILEGLMHCDLVGFHTESYKKHFLECVEHYLSDANIDDQSTIEYKNTKVKAISLPISIDFNMFDKTARSSKVIEKAFELRNTINTKVIGLGVDRLDYTKGIVEKLEGIEFFLDNNPEYIGEFSFIQIAVPTRTNILEYKKMKKELDETVGRINGKFARDGWNPISYIYNSVNIKDLVAYYYCSDFMLISALRDGLNLVAKEYVASRVNNDGMLILSEFAGAAEELDTGYSVNPYDVRSISEAIYRAFNNNDEEKEKIMEKLRDQVKVNNIFKWVDDFLAEL